MTAEVLLAYRAASVGYGTTEIVRSVDLELHAGELVGLLGPNGAGKSTLLRAVTGDAALLGGSIEVAGTALSDLSPRDRAIQVGVVPQQVIAEFSFPAAEFVEMGRHPHLPRFGRPGAADAEAVERALALTDTAHLAQTPVDRLSGGDLQRLAFAQALATQPRVLLLDEPVSHLDLNHQLQVLELTRDLVGQGMAVLAIFHDFDLAARFADRIAVVSGGAVSEPSPPADAITAAMVREVFSVRAVVGTDPVTGSVSVTPVLREGAVARVARGRVHVVGGSGVAAPLMRRLVLDGWTVTGGALNAGDADAVLADALGIAYATIPPFAPMDAAAAIEAAKLAEDADAIVVCDVPFGRGNIDNLLVAVHAGRPLVLVGGIEGRDYAGGAAESYWAEAVKGGAKVVDSADAVHAALAALLGTAGRES